MSSILHFCFDLRGYQLVHWFPDWQGIGWQQASGWLAGPYDWFMYLGFWEIRKWTEEATDE